jgi:hypothetical protein
MGFSFASSKNDGGGETVHFGELRAYEPCMTPMSLGAEATLIAHRPLDGEPEFSFLCSVETFRLRRAFLGPRTFDLATFDSLTQQQPSPVAACHRELQNGSTPLNLTRHQEGGGVEG